MGVPHYRLIVCAFCLMAASDRGRGAAGDPIQSNDYRVDLTRTVTSGSTRKIGMGGAQVGLAEGNANIPDNPAAVAYRPRAFMRPWEFDMVLGSLVTTDDDTDNSGASNREKFYSSCSMKLWPHCALMVSA